MMMLSQRSSVCSITLRIHRDQHRRAVLQKLMEQEPVLAVLMFIDARHGDEIGGQKHEDEGFAICLWCAVAHLRAMQGDCEQSRREFGHDKGADSLPKRGQKCRRPGHAEKKAEQDQRYTSRDQNDFSAMITVQNQQITPDHSAGSNDREIRGDL